MLYKENIVVSNGPVQLVDKSKFGNSVTQGGVTCTNNGDGSWTINGEVTAENRFNINFYRLGANVIPYWLSAGVPVEHNYYVQDCYYDKLGGWLYYYLEVKTYDNFTIYPQIISLTDTFGSGNEPTNKEQVKAKLPDNLYPYNPVNKVSTYKELVKVSDICQLVDTNGKTVTERGVTCTNNGDGSWTLNGINESGSNSYLNFTNIGKNRFPGSVYIDSGPNNGCYVVDCSYDTNNGQVFYTLKADVQYTNLTLKPQLFDLTEMYGAGNEPKTTAEFKAKFPNDYYPYSPKCFVPKYKEHLKASDVCQLLDKSKYPATKTQSGVTYTNNDDGGFTVNGKKDPAAQDLYNVSSIKFVKNHLYLLKGCPNNGSDTTYIFDTGAGIGRDYGGGTMGYPSSTDYFDVYICIFPNATADNLVFKPQLFDLTEMYGAGNEPKTVAEFKEKFPEELYDYSPRCII